MISFLIYDGLTFPLVSKSCYIPILIVSFPYSTCLADFEVQSKLLLSAAAVANGICELLFMVNLGGTFLSKSNPDLTVEA